VSFLPSPPSSSPARAQSARRNAPHKGCAARLCCGCSMKLLCCAAVARRNYFVLLLCG
jgi:hypothetical protein